MKIQIELADEIFTSKEKLEEMRKEYMGKNIMYGKHFLGRITNTFLLYGKLYAIADIDGVTIK